MLHSLVVILVGLQSIGLGSQLEPVDIKLIDPGPLNEGNVAIQGEAWVACYLADPQFVAHEKPEWLDDITIEVIRERDDCLRNGTRASSFVVHARVAAFAPAFEVQPLSIEATADGPAGASSARDQIGIQPNYAARITLAPGSWTTERPSSLAIAINITANAKTLVRFQSPDAHSDIILPPDISVQEGSSAASAQVRMTGDCPAEGFNLRATPSHALSGTSGTEVLVTIPPCGGERYPVGLPHFALTVATIVLAISLQPSGRYPREDP